MKRRGFIAFGAASLVAVIGGVLAGLLGQPGQAGLLRRYLRGDFSLELTKLPQTKRIEATTGKLNVLFPGSNESFVSGYSKCWSSDPWVYGSWALTGKDLDAGKMAEGVVHFAGHHLSSRRSWMQGALQSSLRPVDEVQRSAAV